MSHGPPAYARRILRLRDVQLRALRGLSGGKHGRDALADAFDAQFPENHGESPGSS